MLAWAYQAITLDFGCHHASNGLMLVKVCLLVVLCDHFDIGGVLLLHDRGIIAPFYFINLLVGYKIFVLSRHDTARAPLRLTVVLLAVVILSCVSEHTVLLATHAQRACVINTVTILNGCT